MRTSKAHKSRRVVVDVVWDYCGKPGVFNRDDCLPGIPPQEVCPSRQLANALVRSLSKSQQRQKSAAMRPMRSERNLRCKRGATRGSRRWADGALASQ